MPVHVPGVSPIAYRLVIASGAYQLPRWLVANVLLAPREVARAMFGAVSPAVTPTLSRTTVTGVLHRLLLRRDMQGQQAHRTLAIPCVVFPFVLPETPAVRENVKRYPPGVGVVSTLPTKGKATRGEYHKYSRGSSPGYLIILGDISALPTVFPLVSRRFVDSTPCSAHCAAYSLRMWATAAPWKYPSNAALLSLLPH